MGVELLFSPAKAKTTLFTVKKVLSAAETLGAVFLQGEMFF